MCTGSSALLPSLLAGLFAGLFTRLLAGLLAGLLARLFIRSFVGVCPWLGSAVWAVRFGLLFRFGHSLGRFS